MVDFATIIQKTSCDKIAYKSGDKAIFRIPNKPANLLLQQNAGEMPDPIKYCKEADHHVIRIAPPLIIKKAEIDWLTVLVAWVAGSARLGVLVNRVVQNYFTFFVFPDYCH